MNEDKKGIKYIIKNAKYMVDDVRRNELLVKMYLKTKRTK